MDHTNVDMIQIIIIIYPSQMCSIHNLINQIESFLFHNMNEIGTRF